MVAKGKRARKLAERKRGRPYVVPGTPWPVLGRPKSFHLGTGPSRTRLDAASFDVDGRKDAGLVENFGRFRIETWERAPVPSKQIMPAPIPPMGKATRLRFSPWYGPLYERRRGRGSGWTLLSICFTWCCWVVCILSNTSHSHCVELKFRRRPTVAFLGKVKWERLNKRRY